MLWIEVIKNKLQAFIVWSECLFFSDQNKPFSCLGHSLFATWSRVVAVNLEITFHWRLSWTTRRIAKHTAQNMTVLKIVKTEIVLSYIISEKLSKTLSGISPKKL